MPFDSGPVITISREFGCSGSTVAQILIEKIRFLIESGQKNYLEEIITSFTESYYGQQKW